VGMATLASMQRVNPPGLAVFGDADVKLAFE
jgi:hypothetical protein